MTAEWGLFNDEGCVERGLWSETQALEAVAAADPEDDLHAAELCSDHEEQEAATCEECFAEQEDDQ